jgi:hypothetical protein
LFIAPFRASPKGKYQRSSLDPSTKSRFRWALQCGFIALLVLVAAGCVPSARNNVKKANLLESVIPNTEATRLNADTVRAKGREPSSSAPDSANDGRKQSKSGSLASKEIQWPALSEAASSENQAASKLYLKGNPQEIRKAHGMALELVRKTEDVKAIKICHAVKADEWWFTLYQDSGSSYELIQYVWSVVEEGPQRFLVPKRIPNSQLKAHLAAAESGRTCQAFEPGDASMLADRGDSEKVPAQTKATTPKQSDHTNTTVMAGRSDQKLSKPAFQKQKETLTVAKTVVAKPQPPGRAAAHEPQSHPTAAMKPENRKHDAHADPKPTTPVKRASSVATSEQTGTKEAKATPQARSAYQSDDSKPTCQVFVYGSSMNHSELMNWLDDNGYDASLIVDATPAKLEGYDFVWNYFSPSRGGGTVNLERKANSHVLGLLIEIEDGLLKAFDAKEGHPTYYVRRDNRVPVKRLEDGKTVFAWLYIANPNKGTKRDIWPTANYKQKILQAVSFWGLPEAYTAKIRSWPIR